MKHKQPQYECKSLQNGLLSVVDGRIFGIFIAYFDPNSGPTIEWQVSGAEDVNMNGIELIAFMSGAHKVDEDTYYFRFKEFFVICSFHRIDKPDSPEVRYSQMKCIGLLTQSHEWLFAHSPFLNVCIRAYNQSSANSIEREEVLTDLRKYTKQWGHNQLIHAPRMQNFNGIEKLVEKYGTKTLIIMRAIMDNKRVLCLSDVPLHQTCYEMNLILLLCEVMGIKTSVPLFSVGMQTIDLITSATEGYFACSTDIVLGMQNTVFDILVDTRDDLTIVFNKESLRQRYKLSHPRKLRESLRACKNETDYVRVFSNHYNLKKQFSKKKRYWNKKRSL